MSPSIIIHSQPLIGLQSIQVSSRIVVWDHINKKAVFVGKVLVINGYIATGDNFIHNRKDGSLSERTRINLRECGLIPAPGTRDLMNSDFRVYKLPEDVSPMDYGSFKVEYVTPEQLRHEERTKGKRHTAPLPVRTHLIEI